MQAFKIASENGVTANRAIKISTRLPTNHSSGDDDDHKDSTRDDRAHAAETALIETLRSQVDALTKALRVAEDENKRLSSAISFREQELSRSTKLMNIASSNYAPDQNESGSLVPGNKAEQLAVADTANKRIIDQLNGQVDFLNEQLAREQEKGRQVGEKLSRFESVQMELSQR